MTTIIGTQETMRRTGRSRAWLWRHAKSGAFPAPVQISARAIGWIEDQVEAWIESRPVASAYVEQKKSEAVTGANLHTASRQKRDSANVKNTPA